MGCTKCNQDPCEQMDCSCRVIISTDCSIYSGDDLECSGIVSGTPLTEVLQQLDAFICTKFNQLLSYFNISNVGTGVNIYKGVNGVGTKLLRRIRSTDSIIVTENTDDISPAVNEEWLGEQIEQYNQLNPQCIISDSITVSKEGNCTRIEVPSSSTIQSIYVNDSYTPIYPDTKGDGSMARPFTNTRVYDVNGNVTSVTPNTSIQNALNAYVGAGTRLNPARAGEKITIQNNNSFYTFPGDFNYNNISVLSEGNIVSTTTGLIVDMDNNTYFNSTSSTFTLDLAEQARLTIQGDGFRNAGNVNSSTTYQTGRIAFILGEGTIYTSTNDITKYIFNVDKGGVSNGGTGSNNDGNGAFLVRAKVIAEYQGIYSVGGKSRIVFYNTLQSGSVTNTVDVNLKAFHQEGGQVRMFEKASLIFNGDVGTNRVSAVTFTPNISFTTNFVAQGIPFSGTATNLFQKTNSNNVLLEVTNSNSGYALNVTNVFQSPNLWSVFFRDNNLQTGDIDVTKVDLTQGNNISSSNTVGSNIIETLRKFPTRTSANTALPFGAKFLNTNSNNVNTDTWFIDQAMQ